MRRLKNGVIALPVSREKTNRLAPSRKNERFSGKKSGNRVRLTCR
jgi:hypothetical protein